MRQSSTSTRGRKANKSDRSQKTAAGNKRSTARTQSAARSNEKSNSLSSASARGNKPAASRRSSGEASEGGQHYFEKFFNDQLKDIYYAEQKLVQALGNMRDAATTEELQEAFEDHMHLTERHCRRLEKVFASMGMRPEGKRCEAIEGIVREVETIIGETQEGTMTRDAALIMGAQKVEHYEIATYGGLVTMAITMGMYEQADLLDKTLVEEEQTDFLLTDIAENYINIVAELEGQEAGEEEEHEGEGSEYETGEEGGRPDEQEEQLAQ
ncbi:MAG TPA: ferritin-like domain-containing protein [Puia sp.]|nr:ferritin-like domain-containing protein [Puia sp.]